MAVPPDRLRAAAMTVGCLLRGRDGMEIINKPIGEIKAYGRNAKRHDDRQIDNVANSIRRFGWRQPLVIDRRGVVVIGHCRLMAAKRLGMETAPCVIADDLTDEDIRELRIIDNRLNESPWDIEMAKLDTEGLSFDGFALDWDAFRDIRIDFADFDGDGDGGGSMMARGNKVRVVIGALMFDLDDPTHELYDKTKGADKQTVAAVVRDLIVRGFRT